MPTTNIPELQELINRSTVEWKAESNTITELHLDRQLGLLGVVIPRVQLAELTSRKRAGAVIAGLPAAVDWRNFGGRNHVSPVKSQLNCGACVSFCACATMESTISIATGETVDLSEADLHFCSAHGASCGGWWPSDALAEAARRGVPLEAEFPYESAFGPDGSPSCQLKPDRDDRLYRPSGTATLVTMDERKQWLSSRGPVCAVIHVYDDFFPHGGGGVYRHVSGGHAGYHCVEVIGYSDPDQCWIAKNSWGTDWGDGGFFRIGYGECGIDDTGNDRDPDGTLNRFPMYGVDGISVPGGWRGFELAGSSSASTNGAVTSVSRVPNSMETWWVGVNGSVEGAFWYDGGQWSRYQIAPDGSASINGPIASVSRIPGSMEVWWVGVNGSVEGAFWYDGGQWSRYQIAPDGSASTNGAISVVSRIPNSMELWWLGPAGSIEGAFWYDGGTWNRYQLAPDGSASAASSIASVSRIPGSMELWWVGLSGSVEGAFWYDGGQWNRYQLAPDGSASNTGAVTAVSRIPNSMELWWIGANGSVEDAFWYDGGQWTRFQVAPNGSASTAGSITSASRIPGSMEVWWTGPNGSVEDAYWYEGGQWSRFQLAPDGSAATSASGALTSVSRIPDSMEIWYLGANGSIRDNYWYP